MFSDEEFDRAFANFDRTFDKQFNRMSKFIIAIWAFGAAFSVAVLVTAVWLLLHFFG